MSLKVKVNLPSLPKGYEVSLTGLNATLINGEEVEVDDEALAAYEAATGNKLADVIKHSRKFGGSSKKAASKTPAVPVEAEATGKDSE